MLRGVIWVHGYIFANSRVIAAMFACQMNRVLVISVKVIIGASVSEPHTCEFNGRISLIYVYMFICIVRTSIARVRAQCADNILKTRADLDTFKVQFIHNSPV